VGKHSGQEEGVWGRLEQLGQLEQPLASVLQGVQLQLLGFAQQGSGHDVFRLE